MTTFEQLTMDIKQIAAANLTASYGDSSAEREAKLHNETIDITEQLDPENYPILSRYGAIAVSSYGKDIGENEDSDTPNANRSYWAQFDISFKGDPYRYTRIHGPEGMAVLGDLVKVVSYLEGDSQSISFEIPVESTDQVVPHRNEFRYPADSVAEHVLEAMDDEEYEEFGGNDNRNVLVSLADRASDALRTELVSASGALVLRGTEGLSPADQLVTVFDNFQALRSVQGAPA